MRFIFLFFILFSNPAWSSTCAKSDLTGDSTQKEILAVINCLDEKLSTLKAPSSESTDETQNENCSEATRQMTDSGIRATLNRISHNGDRLVVSISLLNSTEAEIELTGGWGYKLDVSSSSGSSNYINGLKKSTILASGETKMVNEQIGLRGLKDDDTFNIVLSFYDSEINFSFFEISPDCF